MKQIFLKPLTLLAVPILLLASCSKSASSLPGNSVTAEEHPIYGTGPINYQDYITEVYYSSGGERYKPNADPIGFDPIPITDSAYTLYINGVHETADLDALGLDTNDQIFELAFCDDENLNNPTHEEDNKHWKKIFTGSNYINVDVLPDGMEIGQIAWVVLHWTNVNGEKQFLKIPVQKV